MIDGWRERILGLDWKKRVRFCRDDSSVVAINTARGNNCVADNFSDRRRVVRVVGWMGLEN